ncbi:hypothetical protein [Staphylococcus saprophyticus]|uniref:hypothetical protein n=1 Tax=Staphylococcus saprophyticus TaxID=29385 RepID=UPI001431FC69|nr:hypothetical protein [Staphylococcus saprophyticus]
MTYGEKFRNNSEFNYFYISSYATAIAMLIIAIVNIGYLVKEIREKRSDGDGNN